VSETSAEVIRRYLQDAITAGKNTETYLQKFANESGESEAKQLFHQLALEAKTQHEKLAVRLASLGGSSSAIYGLLSQLLGLGSKASQIGHEKDDRTMHNLMAAFATEHGKAALCEAIANMSEAASDYDTAQLARSLRDEASASARKVWRVLSVSASEACRYSTEEDDQKRP
jgi:ferritin-like metal-binding protein YciE